MRIDSDRAMKKKVFTMVSRCAVTLETVELVVTCGVISARSWFTLVDLRFTLQA